MRLASCGTGDGAGVRDGAAADASSARTKSSRRVEMPLGTSLHGRNVYLLATSTLFPEDQGSDAGSADFPLVPDMYANTDRENLAPQETVVENPNLALQENVLEKPKKAKPKKNKVERQNSNEEVTRVTRASRVNRVTRRTSLSLKKELEIH